MKSTTDLKGLRDIKTAISTHARSTSRHKGTAYFEILSLGMEKLRSESELAWLTRYQRRTEARLGEIREDLEKPLREVRQDQEAFPAPSSSRPGPGVSQTLEGNGSTTQGRKWRKMRVEY